MDKKKGNSKKRKISKINSDRVVSISAIVVSLGTLFMIFYQTNLIRKEQKASVRPSLEIGYSINDEDGELRESIFLSNKGLGPAFINIISIKDSSKTFDLDPYEYLSRTRSKHETTYINRIFPGRIIPANESIKMYEKRTDSTSSIVIGKYFRFPYDISMIENTVQGNAIIEIVYESVYGDKWKISSDQLRPEEID